MHMDVLRNPGPTSGVCYQSEYQRYLQSSSSSTIIERGHAEPNYSNMPLCFVNTLSSYHNFNSFTSEFVFTSDVSRCRVRNIGQMKSTGSNSIPVIQYTRRTYTGHRNYRRNNERLVEHNNLVQIQCPFSNNSRRDRFSMPISCSIPPPVDGQSRLRDGLRFACVNARSVRNKTAEIVEHIVNSNIDICIITETWLKEYDYVTTAALSPNGYGFKGFPRQSNRAGGGTGIMFKDSLTVSMAEGLLSCPLSRW